MQELEKNLKFSKLNILIYIYRVYFTRFFFYYIYRNLLFLTRYLYNYTKGTKTHSDYLIIRLLKRLVDSINYVSIFPQKIFGFFYFNSFPNFFTYFFYLYYFFLKFILENKIFKSNYYMFTFINCLFSQLFNGITNILPDINYIKINKIFTKKYKKFFNLDIFSISKKNLLIKKKFININNDSLRAYSLLNYTDSSEEFFLVD